MKLRQEIVRMPSPACSKTLAGLGILAKEVQK